MVVVDLQVHGLEGMEHPEKLPATRMIEEGMKGRYTMFTSVLHVPMWIVIPVLVCALNARQSVSEK